MDRLLSALFPYLFCVLIWYAYLENIWEFIDIKITRRLNVEQFSTLQERLTNVKSGFRNIGAFYIIIGLQIALSELLLNDWQVSTYMWIIIFIIVLPGVFFVKYSASSRMENYIRSIPIGKKEVSVNACADTTTEEAITLQVESDVAEQLFSKYQIPNECKDDFYRLLRGEHIEKKINWVHRATKSKQITYVSIFELLSECTELDLIQSDKEMVCKFIQSNFLKGSAKINGRYLKESFSNWLNG